MPLTLSICCRCLLQGSHHPPRGQSACRCTPPMRPPWASFPRIPCKESAVSITIWVSEVSSLKTNHGVPFYDPFNAWTRCGGISTYPQTEGAHLGLGGGFIENEPWDPILFPFYDTLSAQTRYGGISTCLQTEGPWAPLPRIPCKESAVRVLTSVWEVSSLKNESRGQFLWPILCSLCPCSPRIPCKESAVRGCIYPLFEGGMNMLTADSVQGIRGEHTHIPLFEGGMSMLTADSLQGIRGKGVHVPFI